MAENNKKDYVLNITTQGISFYNSDDAHMPSVLTVGFWNEYLNLRLNPALDNPTNGRKFDYDKSIATALSFDKLACLLEGINKTVLLAVGAGQSTSVSVQVGADGLLSVGCRNGEPYMGIYKGLDPENKKPSSYLEYIFRSPDMITNYDHSTGNYAMTKSDHPEFKSFVLILTEGLKAMSRGYAHIVKEESKFQENSRYQLQNAIAEKLGIEVKSSAKKYGTKKSQVSFGGASPQAQLDDVPVEEMDSLDDVSHLL